MKRRGSWENELPVLSLLLQCHNSGINKSLFLEELDTQAWAWGLGMGEQAPVGGIASVFSTGCHGH